MSGRAWGEGGKVEGKEDERRVWSVSEMEERCEGKRGGVLIPTRRGRQILTPAAAAAAAAAALLLLLQLLLLLLARRNSKLQNRKNLVVLLLSEPH